MFSVSDILKGGSSSNTSYRSTAHSRKPPNKSRMKCVQVTELTDQSTDAASTSSKDSFGFDEDRELIRTHPLYPALKLLAQKCEKATTQANFNDYGAEDIMKLLHSLQDSKRSITTENSSIDSLMVAAVLELRLQLKQLEQLNVNAEKCRQRLNGNVRKAQEKLTKIMQNDHQEIEPPIFDVPVKKRCTSFTIAALLAN
ncbi:Homeobox domain-containing protein [Aphelenchoides bicaudatus]|nr:Homeobox domain-containing protein [Aphelenchoides bicaudatus]